MSSSTDYSDKTAVFRKLKSKSENKHGWTDGGKIEAKYTSGAADLYRQILAKEVAKSMAVDAPPLPPSPVAAQSDFPRWSAVGEWRIEQQCKRCGFTEFYEFEGYCYCKECETQADDIIVTGVADEDFIAISGRGALYEARRSHTPNRRVVGRPGGGLGMEEYCNATRKRYVMGLQLMIQMQTRALVERLKVSPLVMGVAGTVWLRYLSSFPVFTDHWTDNVIIDYDIQQASASGVVDGTKRNFDSDNPKNWERATFLWFRSLRKTIPLSSTLAISFLACHVAREPVLPTDIVRWSLEGKLPYFAAHVEIDRRKGPSPACPISSSLMFRPRQSDSAQKVEYMAAIVAETIGLRLPPVNFPVIASRFLNELSLPAEKILAHACKIYEWSLPPELWLSTNRFRLPTRIYVLSILIVAIRILYDLNGFGTWEKGLSKHNYLRPCRHASGLNSTSSIMRGNGKKCYKPVDSIDDDGSGEEHTGRCSAVGNSDMDSEGILNHLEAVYDKLGEAPEYQKDLRSYLQYCNDVAFAESGKSYVGASDEEELIEKFWSFYLDKEDFIPGDDQSPDCSVSHWTRPRMDDADNLSRSKKARRGYYGDEQLMSEQQHGRGCSDEARRKDKAIRMLKSDMEENRFCYIPPRVNLKRFDFLQYTRKKDEGAYTYAAHADYYILLRVCAKLAQVDARIMHMGVLGFETRLAWLEKRIDHCLHVTPPDITCDFCADKPDGDDHHSS